MSSRPVAPRYRVVWVFYTYSQQQRTVDVDLIVDSQAYEQKRCVDSSVRERTGVGFEKCAWSESL